MAASWEPETTKTPTQDAPSGGAAQGFRRAPRSEEPAGENSRKRVALAHFCALERRRILESPESLAISLEGFRLGGPPSPLPPILVCIGGGRCGDPPPLVGVAVMCRLCQRAHGRRRLPPPEWTHRATTGTPRRKATS